MAFQTSKVENNSYDTSQSASIQENAYGMSFFKNQAHLQLGISQ